MPQNSFPAIHGHRGCRGLRPENTLPAFRHALALGVDVLELDVVVSADRQVVVSHEPWFSGTICRTPAGLPIELATERQHNLYELPYDVIRQYDCGLTRHPGFPEQHSERAYKPLLSEVFQDAESYAESLGRSPVGYSIEVKSSVLGDGVFHPAPPEFLALVLAEISAAEVGERVTLLSFDKRILQVARELFPQLPLCLLVEDERPAEEHLQELGFLPTVYGMHHPLLTSQLAKFLRDRGVASVPWTVNELTDMHRILTLEPAGITTDYPDRLLALRH
ncbi:glycerophosphodiester phosphodiesterase [Hymenobacter taeanensis]|uniref:Glycerophosphodiester phosphodiesterase n=1 Tax=Hymenobacter taeanensis TaxID=2735321 RepID=A0A6M6BHR1_9BACT|nr:MULTISPECIES: glycerophosphodiester phosphodiesterase family protein [Hymenobacter]QJX46813.1 glycerophosphodiester phosphodiesterase [Hymenobacter taeanensis]UOQ80683.1 glycerophosphodiester phosphodiesterase [Hymenobacter sp. 5414T-23]